MKLIISGGIAMLMMLTLGWFLVYVMHIDRVSTEPQEYIITSTFYINDGHFVYHNGQVMPNADPSTFKDLGWAGIVEMDTMTEGGYARDAHAVYYAGKVIEGADVSTFELTPRVAYARDAHHEYAYGVRVKNDFVRCGTSLSELSAGDAWRARIVSLNAGSPLTDDSLLEYCMLKNGGIIVGFVPVSHQPQQEDRVNGMTRGEVKQYFLFDTDGTLHNVQPAILNCTDEGNFGMVDAQSLYTLDNGEIKLQCSYMGACNGKTFHLLNVNDLMRNAPVITPSDEFYDCGYRG